MSSTELVLPLAALNASMLPSVGGKAANLGELLRAGFQVPAGFCLTTDASEAPGAETDQAILRAYAAMGDDVPVAVRSSATAEDLPFASFAGQYDTYLNVVGPADVLAAVRRCWASRFTDRAVSYTATQQFDGSEVRLAVVVQRMVQSAVAGVLFTANPVTGRRREAVIDASPGLGDAVVSGSVNPDHLIVDTATGRLLEASTAAGTTRCLTDEQAAALAAIGDRVERHFGSPQDIEWAFDTDGELWLTQSRPITTLFPLPDATSRSGLRAYFCFSVAQGLYRPLTPMGLSAFRVLASAAAGIFGVPERVEPLQGPPAYAEAGQRMFVDLTGVLRSRVGRQLVPRVFDLMESRSATLLRGLFDRPEFAITQRSLLPSVRRASRILLRFRVPVYVIQALISPAAAHRRVGRIGDRLRVQIAPREGSTPVQRLDHAEHILYADMVPMAPAVAPGAIAGFAMFGLAARLLRGSAEPGELQSVLRGIPHNVTTEMDLELWALAHRIRGNAEAAELLRCTPPDELAARFAGRTLPDVLQRGLTAFLGTYGHRAVAEIDLGVARWSEDPTHILGVLANYLRLADPAQAPDANFVRSDREAVRTIEALAGRAGRRSRWHGRLVRFALNRSRQLAGIREMPKYYMVLTLATARRELAAVGDELAGQGYLQKPDDVFFLTLGETRAALAGQSMLALVAERRADYEREMRRRRVPRVLLSDGTEPENTVQATDETDGLRGVAASPGTVTGTARVILEPVGAMLLPGEILVSPSTDPGWTPLFLTAGGLVMEMGGANSHGSVVAREYGIPAVVGVPAATERISTGDRITVNGTVGTVKLGA